MANANITAGSVVWNFEVDKAAFNSGLAEAQAQAKATGAAINKSISTTASDVADSMNSVANSIGSVLTKIGVATVAGAALGSVFVKSAADLQTTSSAMQVLVGNTEDANKLFGQLAVYANTTPFEFADIAKAGRTLLGFGIGLNDVMPDVKMLGDLASVTGADFNSLAVVFGQVNATGKLMGQDALQLINNNIPITTILAKKLGTSVQDVKARMEDGAISASLFNEALKDVTSEGGFAFKGTDKLAQTFNGRLSTLKDTVLEFGRNLLGVHIDPQLGLTIQPGGVFDKLSQSIPKIADSLKKLQPQIQAAFNFLIDNGPTLVSIVGALAAAFVALKVATAIANVAVFTRNLLGILGILPKVTASQWAFNAAMAANPIGLIITAIAAVVAALVFLQLKFKIFNKLWDGMKIAWEATVNFFKDNAEIFKKIFIAIAAWILLPVLPLIALVALIVKNWDTIKSVTISVFTAIGNFFVSVWNAIVNFTTTSIKNILNVTITIWNAIVNAITTAITAIRNAIVTVWNVMTTVWNAIWGFIQPILKFMLNLYIVIFGSILLVILTVLQAIINVITTVWNAIVGVVTTVLNVVLSVITAAWNVIYGVVANALAAIWSVITTIWNAVYGFITNVLSAIWNVVTTAWNTIYGVISTVIGLIWNQIVTAFNFYKDIIVSTFTAVLNFITNTWNTIYGVISSIVNRIIDFFASSFNWLYGKGKDIVLGLARGISDVAGNVWNAIKNVADQIGRFFAGAGSWLYDVGRNIVQGLVNGIKSMVGAVSDAAGNVGSAVTNKVKNLLGIHSPSTVFKEIGVNTVQGFQDGIAQQQKKLADGISQTVDFTTNAAVNTQSPDFSGDGSTEVYNNIGTINIGSEVDAENWLNKLTRNDQVTSQGLTANV